MCREGVDVDWTCGGSEEVPKGAHIGARGAMRHGIASRIPVGTMIDVGTIVFVCSAHGTGRAITDGATQLARTWEGCDGRRPR